MNNEITNLDTSAFKQSAAPRLIKGTIGARLINPGAPGVSLSPGAPGRLIDQSKRAAFTLIEMLVSLSILIILMAAVGEIFSLAGRTVRVGQATLTAMSSIRAVESQIARDIRHLDTNGFLIIRQRLYAPYWQTGVKYEPGDEVQYISAGSDNFYLCQQANITEPAITTGPGIPAPGAGAGTVDWQLLNGAIAGEYPIWRSDQITFIETGNFHSGTGSDPGGVESTSSNLTANKAIVWFGQFSASYGATGYNFPTYPTAYAPPTTALQYTEVEHPFWQQKAWVPAGTPPSGQTGGQFYFGREATLLIPSGTAGVFGSTVFNNPFYSLSYGSSSMDTSSALNGGSDGQPTNVAYNTNGSGPSAGIEAEYATVTSSRLDATLDALPGAAFTLKTPPPSSRSLTSPKGPGTIEGYIDSLPLTTASLYDIANFFSYRYSTLTTPAASELGYYGSTPPSSATAVLRQMLNGYFRMTPIMLQGVPSFSVDWTDGSYNSPSGTVSGQAVSTTALDWFGLDGNTSASVTTVPATAGKYGPFFSYSAGALTLPNNEAVRGNSSYPGTTTPDGVTYVFYAGNKAAWPKALKITYCVTDPNNRLQGGRFVTQVVNLPQ